jgi:hypothetical protein
LLAPAAAVFVVVLGTQLLSTTRGRPSSYQSDGSLADMQRGYAAFSADSHVFDAGGDVDTAAMAANVRRWMATPLAACSRSDQRRGDLTRRSGKRSRPCGGAPGGAVR